MVYLVFDYSYSSAVYNSNNCRISLFTPNTLRIKAIALCIWITLLYLSFSSPFMGKYLYTFFSLRNIYFLVLFSIMCISKDVWKGFVVLWWNILLIYIVKVLTSLTRWKKVFFVWENVNSRGRGVPEFQFLFYLISFCLFFPFLMSFLFLL